MQPSTTSSGSSLIRPTAPTICSTTGRIRSATDRPDGAPTGRQAMQRSIPAVTALLAATLATMPLAGGAAASDVAKFYQDKQITLVLSTGAGGGYELYARPLARYISRYI